MACVTITVDKSFKERLSAFSWVNWSEVSREDAVKKEIFERYLKTGEISDEDWKFCEEIDWHPVDELQLKDEFKKELKERKKGPFIKLNSVKELFKE